MLIVSGCVMPLKRSLVQRELDDSSSDDDDYVIFSAAQIVHTYSNAKRSHGGSVLGHINVQFK